jgi:hypothetical protein
MPTILRIDGYEIVIFLNDHVPAHVHVFAGGREAVVDLHCPEGDPEIREFYRFKVRELKPILRLVKQHQEQLCAMWKVIHGKF